uniref:Leucine rich repeat transmembrane neuronal 4 like 2 n=1 Tax=Oncorhynchus kisutch TaxID=8019 RepID=A0A8C7D8K0_ONCKI
VSLILRGYIELLGRLLTKGERMCPASCRCEGKIVYCDSNKITLLHNKAFNAVPNLRNLDFSYNQLHSLQPGHFYGLRKLQNLHLRSNGLSSIPVRTFLECRSLEFLDLGYNHLRTLFRTTFLGLFKLKELHLEHNQFSRINLFLFPRLTWVSLTTISLVGNAWDCSPTICPLVTWLKNFRGSKDIKIICSSPKSVQGDRVMDIVRNYTICVNISVEEQTTAMIMRQTTASVVDIKKPTTPPPSTTTTTQDISASTVQRLTPQPNKVIEYINPVCEYKPNLYLHICYGYLLLITNDPAFHFCYPWMILRSYCTCINATDTCYV